MADGLQVTAAAVAGGLAGLIGGHLDAREMCWQPAPAALAWALGRGFVRIGFGRSLGGRQRSVWISVFTKQRELVLANPFRSPAKCPAFDRGKLLLEIGQRSFRDLDAGLEGSHLALRRGGSVLRRISPRVRLYKQALEVVRIGGKALGNHEFP